MSIRYADRLAANDIVASVGSKGDSYNNALAESFNGLFSTTAGSTAPSPRPPRYTTPAAFEAAFYRQSTPAPEPVTQ